MGPRVCNVLTLLSFAFAVRESTSKSFALCYEPNGLTESSADCVTEHSMALPAACCSDYPSLRARIADSNATAVTLYLRTSNQYSASQPTAPEGAVSALACEQLVIGGTQVVNWTLTSADAAPAVIVCNASHTSSPPIVDVSSVGSVVVVSRLRIRLSGFRSVAPVVRIQNALEVLLEDVSLLGPVTASTALVAISNSHRVRISRTAVSDLQFDKANARALFLRVTHTSSWSEHTVLIDQCSASGLHLTSTPMTCLSSMCGGAFVTAQHDGSTQARTMDVVIRDIVVTNVTVLARDMPIQRLAGAIGMSCLPTDACRFSLLRGTFSDLRVECPSAFGAVCGGAAVQIRLQQQQDSSTRAPDHEHLVAIRDTTFQGCHVAGSGTSTLFTGAAVHLTVARSVAADRLLQVRGLRFSACSVRVDRVGTSTSGNTAGGSALALHVTTAVLREVPCLVEISDVTLQNGSVTCTPVGLCVANAGGAFALQVGGDSLVTSRPATSAAVLRTDIRRILCTHNAVRGPSAAGGCLAVVAPFAERATTGINEVGQATWALLTDVRIDAAVMDANAVHPAESQQGFTEALGGGGIFALNSRLSLRNSSVTRNTAVLSTGGGILARGASSVVVVGGQFQGNSASAPGFDVAHLGGGSASEYHQVNFDVTVSGGQLGSLASADIRDVGQIVFNQSSVLCPSDSQARMLQSLKVPSPVPPTCAQSTSKRTFILSQSSVSIVCQRCAPDHYVLECAKSVVDTVSRDDDSAHVQQIGGQCTRCLDGFTCKVGTEGSLKVKSPAGRWTPLSGAHINEARFDCANTSVGTGGAPRTLARLAVATPCPLEQCCPLSGGCALDNLCVTGRQGVLCGECAPERGSSLFSSTCVPNSDCHGLATLLGVTSCLCLLLAASGCFWVSHPRPHATTESALSAATMVVSPLAAETVMPGMDLRRVVFRRNSDTTSSPNAATPERTVQWISSPRAGDRRTSISGSPRNAALLTALVDSSPNRAIGDHTSHMTARSRKLSPLDTARSLMRVVYFMQETSYVLGARSVSSTRQGMQIALGLLASSAVMSSATSSGGEASALARTGCLWPGMSSLARVVFGHATWALVVIPAMLIALLLDACSRVQALPPGPSLRAWNAAQLMQCILREYALTTMLASVARVFMLFADCTLIVDPNASSPDLVFTYVPQAHCSRAAQAGLVAAAVAIAIVHAAVKRSTSKKRGKQLGERAYDATFRVVLAIVGAPLWSADPVVEFVRQCALVSLVVSRSALPIADAQRRLCLGILTLLTLSRGARNIPEQPNPELLEVQDVLETALVGIAILALITAIQKDLTTAARRSADAIMSSRVVSVQLERLKRRSSVSEQSAVVA